jgi:hypothetical protein
MKEVKEVLKDNGWSDLQVEAALYYKHLSSKKNSLDCTAAKTIILSCTHSVCHFRKSKG